MIRSSGKLLTQIECFGAMTSIKSRLAGGVCFVTLGSVLLLGGCVSAPEKTQGKGEKELLIMENQSIDLVVRRQFDAALQLMQEEKYLEAIEILQKVIQASQKNSAPYINIAIAYGMVGKTEEAEVQLKQALQINPSHPVTLNEYALLLRRSGRYTEAREQYERLLKLYPEFMPARRNLGILCELYLRDAGCAMAQYEVYSEANPDDGDVKLWLTTLKQ